MNEQRIAEIAQRLREINRRLVKQNANIGAFYDKGEQVIMADIINEQSELIIELCLLTQAKDSKMHTAKPYYKNGVHISGEIGGAA